MILQQVKQWLEWGRGLGVLPEVARFASRNDIAGGVSTSFRKGDDVIHCQPLGLRSAIRTFLSIGCFDRLPLCGGQVGVGAVLTSPADMRTAHANGTSFLQVSSDPCFGISRRFLSMQFVPALRRCVPLGFVLFIALALVGQVGLVIPPVGGALVGSGFSFVLLLVTAFGFAFVGAIESPPISSADSTNRMQSCQRATVTAESFGRLRGFAGWAVLLLRWFNSSIAKPVRGTGFSSTRLAITTQSVLSAFIGAERFGRQYFFATRASFHTTNHWRVVASHRAVAAPFGLAGHDAESFSASLACQFHPGRSWHYLRSRYASTIRRTNSGTEIARLLASASRYAIWGSVKETMRLIMTKYTTRMSRGVLQ